MRIRFILGIFLALCTSIAAAQTQQLSSPVHIKGVVRNAVTRQPVPYVRVILELVRYGPVDEATTDQQGRFEFPHLNHAMYAVRLQVPGYRGTDQAGFSCDPAGCRRVDLSAESMAFLTFELQPISTATETAAGGPVSAADLKVPEAARTEFDKAQELSQSGNTQDSIAHFKKAIELYPEYQKAYFRMGLAYVDLKDVKSGEAALVKATGLDGNDAAAFLALGTLYADQKDFSQAATALSRGLTLKPDYAEGQCELSRVEWALKRYPESEQHAQKCAELKPGYPPAQLLLGNIALSKRDRTAALRHYAEYLRLAPQGPYAAAVHQEIDRLTTPQAQ